MELCVCKFCMIFCKNVFTEWKFAFFCIWVIVHLWGDVCLLVRDVYRCVRRKWMFVLVEDKHMNQNFMFWKGCLGILLEICLCLHCCIKLSVWKLVRVFDLMVREHEFTPRPSSVSWFVMSVIITLSVHVEFMPECVNCNKHQYHENVMEQMISSGSIAELCLRRNWF